MRRAALLLLLAGCATGGVPSHPDRLVYAPLRYEIPDAAAYRVDLAGGAAGYLVEDPSLPIVDLSISFRAGSFADPDGKEGLADLTATLMRTGGTRDRKPEELDEELDFLAADLSVSMSGVFGSASLSILSKDLDRGLELLGQVLRHPTFNADRLATAKAQVMLGLSARNDHTGSIEGREANLLFYGDHPVNRLPTGASIESITREDLVAFHREWVRPSTFMVSAAGAFKKAELVKKLNALIGRWEPRPPKRPAVPEVTHRAKPGIYCFHKEGENINQGRVTIGHLGVDIRHPDVQTIRIMSYILGSGGFSSRLMQKVRTEEGLAYSVRSSLQPGLLYPSVFSIEFQSKSETCARAAKLCLEELKRLQEQGPTEKELRDAIQFYQDGFPGFFFSTPAQTASTFARAELLDYPKDYYRTYRERIAALTVKDVREAARKYLRPSEFAWVVVGNMKAVKKGDGEVGLAELGRIVDVPLADPVTLERPSQ